MKKLKNIFSIVAMVLVAVALTGCFDTTLAEELNISYINVTASSALVQVNEIVTLDVVAKNNEQKTLDVDANNYIVSTNQTFGVIDGLTVYFVKSGTYSVTVKVKDTDISDTVSISVYQHSPVATDSLVDRSSNSASNLHITFDFQLRESFTFDGYNFEADPTNVAEFTAELVQTLDDFYGSDEDLRFAASQKLGNNILMRFYTINDLNGEKVILNAGAVLSYKDKAWGGYLNSKTSEDGDTTNLNINGQNFGLVLTANQNIWYTHSANFNPNLVGLSSGDTVYTELTFIVGLEIFVHTISYTLR